MVCQNPLGYIVEIHLSCHLKLFPGGKLSIFSRLPSLENPHFHRTHEWVGWSKMEGGEKNETGMVQPDVKYEIRQ